MDTDYFEGMKRVLRMQHGEHDLVDPYMIVSFAGKKLKTKVGFVEMRRRIPS